MNTLRQDMFSPVVTTVVFVSKPAPQVPLFESITCAIISIENKNIINIYLSKGFAELVESKMLKSTQDGQCVWCCTDCDFMTRKRSHLVEHVETKHAQSTGYYCTQCQKTCSTSAALRKHNLRYHKIQ